MDTATFFVAYSPSHPGWELGWDALVGIGTLALAAVTFWAERRRLRERHDELVKKNIAAANKAVFQLIRTHQTFADVQHQLVDPWRDDRGRHFMIRPLVADLKPIAIDFDGLSFLFESADRNVMSELSAFEQEVAATIKIIEERSVFHRTIIQPAVERFGGREVSGAEVEAAVGMMNVTILKQSTDYMIEGIYNVVAGSRVCSEKLRNAVKRMYPKQAILFLKAPDETKLPKG